MRTDIFRQWLAEEMKKTEISQTRLGDLLDVHPSYISQVLGGKRTPSYKVLEKVASKFQISFSEILVMVEEKLCGKTPPELVISQNAKRSQIEQLLQAFIEYIDPNPDIMFTSEDIFCDLRQNISVEYPIAPNLLREEVYRNLLIYHLNDFDHQVAAKEENRKSLDKIMALDQKEMFVDGNRVSRCSVFLSILPGYLFLQVGKDLEADIDIFMYFHSYFHNLVNLYNYPRSYIVSMTTIDSAFKNVVSGKAPHPNVPFNDEYVLQIAEIFREFEVNIHGDRLFGPDPKEVDQFDSVQVLELSEKDTGGMNLSEFKSALDRKKPHWIGERVKGEGIIQVVLNLKQEDFLGNIDTVIKLTQSCKTI